MYALLNPVLPQKSLPRPWLGDPGVVVYIAPRHVHAHILLIIHLFQHLQETGTNKQIPRGILKTKTYVPRLPRWLGSRKAALAACMLGYHNNLTGWISNIDSTVSSTLNIPYSQFTFHWRWQHTIILAVNTLLSALCYSWCDAQATELSNVHSYHNYVPLYVSHVPL